MKSKFTKTVDLKITFTILVGLVTKFVELTKFTHHYHSLHKDTCSFLFLFFFCRDRGHARPAPVNSSPPPPWPRGTAPRPPAAHHACLVIVAAPRLQTPFPAACDCEPWSRAASSGRVRHGRPWERPQWPVTRGRSPRPRAHAIAASTS